MKSCLLGIDIGTTGCKALLLDETGGLLGQAFEAYPLHAPLPLWSEQDPELWWLATVKAIREVFQLSGVDSMLLEGVGLTGQMHGLVLLGADGTVLRNCILWNDQRTGAQCTEINRILGPSEVLSRTGKPVLPSFTAPKILWVREHENEVFLRTAHVLLPKDYIRYRLSGVIHSEVSDASGTSLFNIQTRNWDDDIISELGLKREWFPGIHESPVISSSISADAARDTGLQAGIPIVAGAGDQAAEAIGCGIVTEGSVSVTIGTSGVAFAALDSCHIDPEGRLHAYCHAIPDTWHFMGVMLSAGGSLRWFRDTFCQDIKRDAEEAGKDAYGMMTNAASRIGPGAEGLFFLPYLTGERTPYPDPYARGVFAGITLRHDRSHFVRAVLEGITYGLKDSLDLLDAMGISVESVRISGGGAKSAFWQQLMADVFRKTIVRVNVSEGAAFGASILAGVGAGIWNSVEDAVKSVLAFETCAWPRTEPSLYTDLHQQYAMLYEVMKDEFKHISDRDAAISGKEGDVVP